MSAVVYNIAKELGFRKSIDFLNESIRCILMGNSYVPDIDGHQYYSDIAAHECTGPGYTAFGKPLQNKTVTRDMANDWVVFDASDPLWTGVTVTARYAILLKDSGSYATSPLICCLDLGGDKVMTAGNFLLRFDPTGILRQV